MKGPIPWLGGKTRLAKQIIAHLKQIPHSCYVEPFMGGGQIFFRKDRVNTEILNDINSELVNLFRVIQNHPEAFYACFKYQLCSREEFGRLKAQPLEQLTDIQRAYRFYFLQKLCFGGNVVSRAYGITTTGYQKLNPLAVESELSAVYERLARVNIENQSWEKIIERYDRPHTLFYLDPPYYGCENDYGKNLFSKADFLQMAKILGSIEGKFVLSLNDHPEVRKIFQEFFIQSIKVKYSQGTRAKNRQIDNSELFISNTVLTNQSKMKKA